MEEKNNLTQKQQCLKSSVKGPFFEEKQEGTSKGETQFVTSQHTMGNVHCPPMVISYLLCGGTVLMPLHVADSYCNGSAEYMKLRS